MPKAMKNIADKFDYEFDDESDTTNIEFEEVEADDFETLDFVEDIDFLFD